jgi:phosphoribosylaminoimidazolecarboxamide formyltransferase/IMP cyclohydrolase
MPHPAIVPIRRALISVSDKTGLIELGQRLAAAGVELLSTGGSAKALRDAGIAVKDVSDVTGFPEIMDGRVKTLHPKVHGGLLGRRGVDDAKMAELDIAPIDLLVLNLYPFEQTVARADCTLDEAIENIDIGGPAMLRSAAKNWNDVGVLTSPDQYADALTEIEQQRGLSRATRFKLAVAAFNRSPSPRSIASPTTTLRSAIFSPALRSTIRRMPSPDTRHSRRKSTAASSS